MKLGRRALQPAGQVSFLRLRGARVDLEPPLARGLRREREVETQELLAPRDEQRHLVTRLVLVEAVVPTVRSHPELVDPENLVVDVDAGLERRAVAANLRDHQPAGIVAGRESRPWSRP